MRWGYSLATAIGFGAADGSTVTMTVPAVRDSTSVDAADETPSVSGPGGPTDS